MSNINQYMIELSKNYVRTFVANYEKVPQSDIDDVTENITRMTILYLRR